MSSQPLAGSRRGRLFRRYFLFIMALVCGALLWRLGRREEAP